MRLKMWKVRLLQVVLAFLVKYDGLKILLKEMIDWKRLKVQNICTLNALKSLGKHKACFKVNVEELPFSYILYQCIHISENNEYEIGC